MAGKENEYLTKLLAVLQQYGKTMNGEGALLVKSIRELLGKGLTVPVAVEAALKQRQYNKFVANAITDSVYKMALAGYGISTSIRVDHEAQKALSKKLVDTPWTGDKMKLSTRLHGTNTAMREAIVSTIQTSINRQESLKKLSMQLYDGYNSGNKVIAPAELPEYLKKLHGTARAVAAGDKAGLKEFEKTLASAKANMAKLTARNAAGTPNTNLVTTYKNLLKEAKKLVSATGKLNTAALDRAVWSAVQEKSRYHADRIARTENARAWFDGFILETQNDDLVWGYRWVLSNRHKYTPFDQCDVCANMDVGYGKGVYAKDKVPSIPRHPHCMCSLEVVYYDEVNPSTTFNPDKAREYINKLTHAQKEALFGANGAKAYAQGDDWQKWLRGWDGFGRPVTRLETTEIANLKSNSMVSEIEKCYNEIVEKEPAITEVVQRIVEASGGNMEGLAYRIKTKESFMRKVDTDYQLAKAGGSDITQLEVANNTNDVIRYTGVADEESLYSLYLMVMSTLESEGFKSIKVKNTWDDNLNPYRGINTIIQSLEGQNFELQFHTPESFHLKQHELHELYEEYRQPSTSLARKKELFNKMFELSNALTKPQDIDKIKNRGAR
ncbi:hypothetical protein [Anaerospora sp.]|uniref:hypothetical protein n=1 Tax=Anaerospora sp. TaxID=1960278 RepID=UPI00289AD840|nr:hypothetical protein [Anaerospora sp.]